MNIIQKDISWLVEKVPDFPEFYKENADYFKSGYLAGGFLRRSINLGSINEALNHIVLSKKGDIDFFFYDKLSAMRAVEAFYKKDSSYNKTIPNMPNSFAGFAYEGFKGNIKYQFIILNTGAPEQVLSRFDIANCKISTDGKTVWMDEDWEELEKEKIIRIDNYAGKYFPQRLLKYLTPDYKLFKDQKEELLSKLLEKVLEKAYIHHGNIMKLLSKENFLSPEEVLIFYGKVGTVLVNDNNEIDYSSLAEQHHVDYALHVYKKRTTNAGPANT